MTYTKMQIDSYVALVLGHICVDGNINRNKKKNNIDGRETKNWLKLLYLLDQSDETVKVSKLPVG